MRSIPVATVAKRGATCFIRGLSIVLGVLHLQCAAARSFTVADDIALAHFGDPYSGAAEAVTFSPDGTLFLVDIERGNLSGNWTVSTIRVYGTEDVRQFVAHPESRVPPKPLWVLTKASHGDAPVISNIRWLDNSQQFAYLEKATSGKERLVLADVVAKAERKLTPANGDVTAFDVRAADRFVYSLRGPAIEHRKALDGLPSSLVGTGKSLNSLIFPGASNAYLEKHRDRSELWSVVGGKRFRVEDRSSGRRVTLFSAGQNALSLSPDGRYVVTARAVDIVPPEWEAQFPPVIPSYAHRIRAGAQDLGAPDAQQYVSEYVLLNLQSGIAKSLTNAPIGNTAGWLGAVAAGWSMDGKSIALSNTFLASNARGNTGGPNNRPCIAIVSLVDWTATCLEALRGQTSEGYEDGLRYIYKVAILSDSRCVKVNYELLNGSMGSTTYARSNQGVWTEHTPAECVSKSSPTIEASIREDLSVPPVLVVRDTSTEISHDLWDPNPQLHDVTFGTVESLTWKDAAGKERKGGLFVPPNYAAGRRYPLVIQTHGFFQHLFRPDGLLPTAFAAQELAAAGIFVLQAPDCPSAITPEEAACNVAVYEAAVEQLVSDGRVDRERVGIIGFSRTCYYVLEALTASHLSLRAASITDGVNEGYLQYLASLDVASNAVADESTALIGAPPFADGLRQWLKHSPEFNLSKVTAPLQVVALGRADVLVMWEPYAVLRYLRKPVDLLVIDTDEHVLTNPAARLASQGGSVDWFRFWLQDYENPDPAKAEQYVRWRELRKRRDAQQLSGTKEGDT